MSQADTRTAGQKLRATMTNTGTGEIPIWGSLSMATWLRYGDDLIPLLEKYPGQIGWVPPRGTDYDALVAPGYRADEEYLDNWGCLWYALRHGMEGLIKEHPLADIRHLRHYRAPDPLKYSERGEHNWGAVAAACNAARAAGGMVTVGGERFFERVHFLRGMLDALTDMAEEVPEMDEIVQLVLDYNMRYLEQVLRISSPVDLVMFGDDWGCQDRCLISPRTFRRYFKPGYTQMYALCKQYGALTGQHSDGHTVDLWEEFLEAGLTAFNMQINCMGVDMTARLLKGRMCLIVSVDRQYQLPYGTPAEVRDHIREIALKLGSPHGGLIIAYDMYPDVPMENLEALMAACEEVRDYWTERA